MTKLGYFLVLLLLAEGAAPATSAGASSNSAGHRVAGVAPSSSLVHDQHFEDKEAAAATSVGVTLTSEDVVVLLLDNKNAPSSAATPRTSSRTSPSGDGGGLVLETAAGRGVVSTDGQQQQSSSTSTTSNMTMAKNKRKFFTTTSAGGGGRGRVRGATSSRTQNEHPADDTVLRTSRDLNELGEGQLLRQKKKQERKTAAKKKKVDKKGGSSCSKSANKKGDNIVELSTTADICGKDLDRPNTKYILVNDIICGKDGPNVSRGASLDCQGYTIIQDPSTIVPHVGIQIFAADGESALVKNCKVEGFTKSDYSVEGAGTVVLADSKSNKSKGAGLSVLGGSTGKFQIVDFEAKESGSQGIAVDQRFSGTINFQNPKIEDSTDQGILIEGDGIINIHKPDISSSGLNDMDGNRRSGLRIREPSSATVTVVDPSIHDNTNFGIFNTGGGNLFVQGGTIEKIVPEL